MTLPRDTFRHIYGRKEKADPGQVRLLERWLRDTLASLPGEGPWTTRDFIAALGMDSEPTLAKTQFSRALYHLRQTGKIEDCYSIDNSRRYMGNPLILWRRPINEGIF
jgi:hypothetical protein